MINKLITRLYFYLNSHTKKFPKRIDQLYKEIERLQELYANTNDEAVNSWEQFKKLSKKYDTLKDDYDEAIKERDRFRLQIEEPMKYETLKSFEDNFGNDDHWQLIRKDNIKK